MSSDKGQGAIAEGEAQRANLSLPVGDDAFHPRAAARLKATKQEINNGFRRKVDGMVRPGTIRQGYDKKGNPVMKKVLLPYAPEVQQRYEQEAIRRSRGQGSGSQSVPTGAPVRE